ncbi:MULTISPECIES: rhodanese-like domain-containing protein [Gammaproteobacteria]|uniref:rhodanese-like domain-containing protein n=1 Tax=Gammaproteobacteria TaxID=1236 RepID=UPI000DD02283|nr:MULTISPECIES: rhodanese-like domain-containing protein [Gammaproteobacteria]RTE86505.1 rhodanese-like domain-containing protein [Aliidiomarina sp. B3213]TCZ90940.1 rhodanese-like domain-containing protein [Lysobacter sp. N42]
MDSFIQFATEHYILSALWLAVFTFLIADIIKRRFSTVTTLSPQQATIAVNRGGIFVDIRTDDEFAGGFIHGSKNIPLAKIRAGETKALDKFKDAPIVTVCNYGNSARTAASLLEKAGFTKVSVLQGGLQGWRGANMPLSKKNNKK